LRERARALHAKLTLDSKPGQGTHLWLQVPTREWREM
jgi:signal transduction histidine kinase